MRTIVVANQKGGATKTTISVHLAHRAVELGKKVVIIDVDMQGNVAHLLTDTPTPPNTLKTISLFQKDMPESPVEYISEDLAIIRATEELVSLQQLGGEAVLNFKQNLYKFQTKDFDLCIIDTPPSLGIALTASLICADYVVSPTGLEKLELVGISALLKTIKNVQENYNPNLRFLGIQLTKISTNSPQEMENLKQFKDKYGELVLDGYISKSVAIGRAAYECKPVWRSSRKNAVAAKQIKMACEQILNKIFK